ncbi:MAG: L,D-transpeptidase [Nanoarchaeota archaeon]|nr:L,D-transpeptidase [Nanoarchaeota archaeon]
MDRRTFLLGAGATTLLQGCVGGGSIYHQYLRDASRQREEIGDSQATLERVISDNNSSLFNSHDEKLKNSSLSFEVPYMHYVKRGLNSQELTSMRIDVDTSSRNVFVRNNNGEIVFRAPTILGGIGRNANGNFYTSSFSGRGVLWAPSDRPGVLVDDNVFGDLWLPMQNQRVAVDRFEGGWSPRSYNLYAIHGTNNNEAFEDAQTFRNTNSRGCSRLYRNAVIDFRRVLELSSPTRFDISNTARGKNPSGETIALNRVIPVTFGRNLL